MMEDYNDKSKTMEFTPVRKEKPQVERTENSEYSQARRSSVNTAARRKKKDNSTKILALTAVLLSVLIIIVVVAGILIINMDKIKQGSQEEIDIPQVEISEEMEEEEELLPEENTVNDYSIVFYSDSVNETEEGYSIFADLYDNALQNKKSRKLFITGETKIRQNGKRLSAEGLLYAIERMAGEGAVFDAQIRENDSVIVSVSYEGNLEEELQAPEEEPEEITEPEEGAVEETTPEGGVVIE